MKIFQKHVKTFNMYSIFIYAALLMARGTTYPKVANMKIILTFSLFSIPHLIIEALLFIQTIKPSRFNLESLLNKPS